MREYIIYIFVCFNNFTEVFQPQTRSCEEPSRRNKWITKEDEGMKIEEGGGQEVSTSDLDDTT